MITKILNNAIGPWSAWTNKQYTASGGKIMVQVYITAFSTIVGNFSYSLLEGASVVETVNLYFNLANVHTVMPTLTYLRPAAYTGILTYTISPTTANLIAETIDYATMVVTEY